MDSEEKTTENNENNKKKPSKFQGGSGTNILWTLLLAVFCVIIAIEVFAIIQKNKNSTTGGNNNPVAVVTNAPSEDTEVEESGEASDKKENGTTADSTESATSTATAAATATATANPTATAKPTATADSSSDVTPGTGSTTDCGPAKIIDSASIDYSFLDGVSTSAFADCDEGSYDWYPGKVTRLSDGTIKYDWDRYDSTLNYLKKYNGIYRKNTDQNVIYLTFDCGYENGNTAKILDALKEKNATGIFFVTGGYVDDESNHALLRRMVNEGHLIGSHTENHKIMPKLSNTEFVNELNSLYKKLKAILGDDFEMSYYRPPQGASSPRDLALAQYLGYNTVFWAFAYGDYDPENQPEESAALEKMESCLHPGAVYLLHAVSSTNAAVLGDFIDYVRSQGYEINRIDA